MGCYYLTTIKEGALGAYQAAPPPRGVYGSFEEARLAYDLSVLSLHAPIRARDARVNGAFVATTVGRIIFDDVVPDGLPFQNNLMDKKALKDLVSLSYKRLGNEPTAQMADKIKSIGFHIQYAIRDHHCCR